MRAEPNHPRKCQHQHQQRQQHRNQNKHFRSASQPTKMTHIPFQHSYAKGGSACYTRSTASATATMPTSTAPAENSAASVGGGTSASAAAGVAAGPPATLYSDASSSMSTESFPSDTSCSSEDHDDLNAGDYMMDTPPTSNSSEYTEVMNP